MRHCVGVAGAALLMALALAGCGGGGEPVVFPTAAFVPLTVGNSWRYDTVFSDVVAQSASRRGMRLRRPPGRVGTAQTQAEEVITITGTQVFGGGTWYEATLAFTGGSETEKRYLRHDLRGLLWRDTEADEGYYRLRAPLQVGTTWGIPGDPTSDFEIVGVGVQVSTPAGLFSDCLAIEDRLLAAGEPDDIFTTWFARDVGLVKEEWHVGANLLYSRELTSYELAAATASAK